MKKKLFALLLTASLRGCGFVSESEAEDRAEDSYTKGFVDGSGQCGNNDNSGKLSTDLKQCQTELYDARVYLASCLSGH